MANVPQKPRRPRDVLGRPKPWDAPNELDLEDFESLTPEENHRLGREHFNAGRFFPAHEAWETVWKQRKGEHVEEFFKGLSQLGAGYVHLHRGNAHGAKTLLRRGARRIVRYAKGTEGVDTEALARIALEHAEEIDRESAGRGTEARGVVDPSRITAPSI